MILISKDNKGELIKKLRSDYNKHIALSKNNHIINIVANHNDIIDFLKDELYTEEYHFIIELLQNAEDNFYKVKQPRITFRVEPQRLLVQNNEIGFQEDNVIAICSVGPKSSTKKGGKGYIGHKGIGFKSIFSITNNPEIYSNGYSFKFNRLDDLGMINPIWIDDLKILKGDLHYTNFIFPYKNAEEIYPKLKQAFNKLNPEVLLFLDKLKILEIEIDGKKREFEKREDNSLISIGNKKWKLIKKSFKIPDNIIDKSIRRYITETEIVFAFPLDKSGKSAVSQSCDVYSYFPLRSYRFNFIIQADFHTTANRESLIKKNVRNDWIISKMTDMVKYSIDIFKKDKFLKTSFYDFLPYKKDRIEEPFRIFVEELYKKLEDYPFVLTENNDWVIPSDIKIISPEIRELFPKKDFKSLFGVDYELLHPDLAENYSLVEFLKKLGAEMFEFNDFYDLLKNFEWIKKQSDQWFLKLFIIISNYYKSELTSKWYRINNENIAKIKNLRIYKLRNGEIVKNNNDCYYEIKDTGYGFENRLNILIEVFNKALPNERSLKELFEILDITIGDSYGIMKYIEAFYKNGQWKDESEDFLLNTILFLKKHRFFGPMFHWFIRFKTKNDKYLNPYEQEGRIFLSSGYSDDNGLEKLLDNTANLSHHYISEDYLNKTTENLKDKNDIKDEKKAWISFFTKFNIADKFLILSKSERQHIRKGTKFEFVHRNFENFTFTEEEYSLVPGRYTYHTIKDYYIPHVKLICNDIIRKQDNKRAEILLKYINKLEVSDKKCYKKHYGEFGKDKRVTTKIGNSDWLQVLIDSAIFPTRIGLKRPVNVYSLSKDIIEVLGENNTIPILSFKLNKILIEKLNISSSINIDLILKILKEKKSSRILNKDKYRKIYRYINDNISPDEIEELRVHFNEASLIYLEKSQEFFAPNELIWEDKNDILDTSSKYAPLSKEYPDLRDFFVGKLMVKESENIIFYVNRLKEISKKKVEDIDESIKLIVNNIYVALNDSLKRGEISSLNQLSFLVKQNENLEFISKNQEKIYINDKNSIYNLFKFSNIFFLDIPSNFYLKIPYLIEKAGFQYISEVVDTNLSEINGVEVLNTWTEHVQFLLQFIKWYLFYKNHDYYNSCKINLFKTIEKIKCSRISDLEIVYELNGIEIKNKISTFYDADANTIYIDDSILFKNNIVYNKLAITIDEIFKGHDIINFIALFFRFESSSDIESYFKSMDMPPVPEIKIDYSFLEPIILISPVPPNTGGGVEINGSGDGGDLDNRKEIGWQGEENSIHHLRKLKEEDYLVNEKEDVNLKETDNGFYIEENNKVIFEAIWENFYGEHSPPLPYDISFIENGIKHYIEVKSTKSSSKDWFPITNKEWDLLINQGERYYIYRVYKVVIGKAYNDDIKIIHNPLKEWKEGRLIAYPYKIEI